MTAPKNWSFSRSNIAPREMLREIILAQLPPKPTVFLTDLTVSAALNRAELCRVEAQQTGTDTVYTELKYVFESASERWASAVSDSGKPDAVRERVLARKDIPEFERYALDNVVDEAVHHEGTRVSIQSTKVVDGDTTTISITSSWPKPRD
jgi:hypothetical protein